MKPYIFNNIVLLTKYFYIISIDPQYSLVKWSGLCPRYIGTETEA